MKIKKIWNWLIGWLLLSFFFLLEISRVVFLNSYCAVDNFFLHFLFYWLECRCNYVLYDFKLNFSKKKFEQKLRHLAQARRHRTIGSRFPKNEMKIKRGTFPFFSPLFSLSFIILFLSLPFLSIYHFRSHFLDCCKVVNSCYSDQKVLCQPGPTIIIYLFRLLFCDRKKITFKG